MNFLAISLLAILAGTLLLIKIRKEQPGKFFTFISWFFIVVGFILFIGFMVGGISKMAHVCKTGQSECRQELMMKGCQPGMHKRFCLPADECRGMHGPMTNCMHLDSTMKDCCKRHGGDTAKMAPSKPE